MKVLFFDHHYGLDIFAMQRARPQYEFRTISAEPFHDWVIPNFPEELKRSVDNEEKFPPEFRHRWFEFNDRIFEHSYSQFPFELLIVPIDDQYYFRRFQRLCHQRGIPIVMVLKEGSIAPFVMNDPAAFSHIDGYQCESDLVTVSTERTKECFARMNVPREIIHITGQPRFDCYFHKELQRPLKDFGLEEKTDKKRILYLAYHPHLLAKPAEAARGEFILELEQMRDQTFEALKQFVRKNPNTELLVKCHPQQNHAGDVDKLLRTLKKFPRGSCKMFQGSTGVVELMLASDLVIGYCTTAVVEAMAIQKPVIFTFWEEMWAQYEERTLPHHRSGACEVAKSPQQLFELVDQALYFPQYLPNRESAQKRYIQEQLGPVDGKNSERTWQVIEAYLAKLNSQKTPYELVK